MPEQTPEQQLAAAQAAGDTYDPNDPTAIAPLNDERWAMLREPFGDDVLEWKPQPLFSLPKDATKEQRRAESGKCKPGVRNQRGSAISADDYFCEGYHVPSIHLAYVGHAELTMRLNEVVSPAGWRWEPLVWTPQGTPWIDNGGMWIKLTILGHTKLGYGDMGSNSGHNGVKELVGDALRNAARMFGVATYLWSKSEKSMALKYMTAAEKEDSNNVPPPAQRSAEYDPEQASRTGNGWRQPEQPAAQAQRAQERPAEQPPAQQPQQQQRPPEQPAADDAMTLARRRHKAALAAAHPEWTDDEKREAIETTFHDERKTGGGWPVTIETATPDDWNWLADFWEDYAREMAGAPETTPADYDGTDNEGNLQNMPPRSEHESAVQA